MAARKLPHTNGSSETPAHALRRKAEEIASKKEVRAETLSPEETARMLHELYVHQIELEMQNDELRKIQSELEAQKERYFDLYDLAPIGYCTLSEEGAILEANLSAAALLGISRSKLKGKPFTGFIHKEDQDIYYLQRQKLFHFGEKCSCELRLLRKNGGYFWAQVTATAEKNNNGTPVARMVMSDMTEKKLYEEKLNRIAQYDALTELPNRVLLSDRLRQEMARAQRRGLPLAVIYLDLDDFKAINDTHGHEVGDRVLVVLSGVMKQSLREGDTLSRIGGDEFIAILPDLTKIEEVVPMLKRLLSIIAEPIHVGDLVLQTTASLGVTFYPQARTADVDLLLRQADQAMYQAKLSGKNRYHVFDTRQDTVLRERYEFIENVRKALQSSEFLLYYQPIVNMRTGSLIGAEALVRWQHPQKGLLEPAVFLPMIEDNPLSVELGEWVIHTALTQMEVWQAEGFDVHVSVNIGARQLQEDTFVNRLREIFTAHPNVDPSHLILEVVESSKLENIDRTIRIIESCRDFGVLFSLDDFGTGYSSLTYLKRLPISTIKIDQSFIGDLFSNQDTIAILSGIITLANAFHLEIIAEGVETIEHGELLLQVGCERAQGYAIAPPMPPHEFREWSAAWRPSPSWSDLLPVSHDDLPLLYAGIEQRACIGAVEALLKGEAGDSPFNYQCRLGTWIDAVSRTRYSKQPAFQDAEVLREKVHALVEHLLELHARGENAKALSQLDELYELRDALQKELKILLSGSVVQ